VTGTIRLARATMVAGLLSVTLGMSSPPEPVPGIWTFASLDGCDGDLDRWEVREGILVGSTSADRPLERNAYLWFPGTYGDFLLTCRFRIAGGNSGVQYRSEPRDGQDPRGFQADIDAGNLYTGRVYEAGEGGRGLINERGERVAFAADGSRQAVRFAAAESVDAAIRPGDWNDYRIEAVGGTVRHLINGVMVSEVAEAAPRRRSGRIGVQLHVGEPMTVEFRDLSVRNLAVRPAGIGPATPGAPPESPTP